MLPSIKSRPVVFGSASAKRCSLRNQMIFVRGLCLVFADSAGRQKENQY
jgi:hypothetical protein